MTKQPFNTRNEALEFARRTRRNLEFVEQAADIGRDVHRVTQLTLSLLGLVVFPKEKLLLESTRQLTLQQMESRGWPAWTITLDTKEPTKTLHDLLTHLRNAVAHGRLFFTSDSDKLEGVAVRVEDSQDGGKSVCWRAEIQARDLREFCLRFLDYIDDAIG